MAANPDVKAENPLRLIKKYPNRRLYDTKTSSYITLADVKQMVLKHEEFQVVDAKSSEDLTRAILLQIILEEESGGVPMFSTQMLANIIRYYGHSMQGLMQAYMEQSQKMFAQFQDQMQNQARNMFTGFSFPGFPAQPQGKPESDSK